MNRDTYVARQTFASVFVTKLLTAVATSGGLGSARYLATAYTSPPRRKHSSVGRPSGGDGWGPAGKSRGGSLNCKRVVGG